MTSDLTRRNLFSLGAAGLLASPGVSAVAARPIRRPRVAAIFTVLRFRSHAYNILENFMGPYLFRGQMRDPGVDVVSFYADQFPEDDMARDVARRTGVPLYPSIPEALRCGGNDLAVDAVLSIGEHGDYPWDSLGRHLYPRKRFFDESVKVMEDVKRYVPFFNDKHLSYRRDESRTMFDTARENQMPLMAGSSVPLAQRMPPVEIPPGARIEEAVSIHGGGLESYDFHAFEVLQSFVESRSGGETGVADIQLLTGQAYQEALKQGRWSKDLVDAAMAAERQMNVRRQRWPRTGVFSARRPTVHQPPEKPNGPYAISIRYNDGMKATVLRLTSSSDRWNFACRLKGEQKPRATALFNGPWGNRCLFKALSHAIQYTFTKQQEPWPAERTLLTSGMVDAVMTSWNNNGKAVPTPHLKISYQAADWSQLREDGATWKIITPDTPQPVDFQPRPWSDLRPH